MMKKYALFLVLFGVCSNAFAVDQIKWDGGKEGGRCFRTKTGGGIWQGWFCGDSSLDGKYCDDWYIAIGARHWHPHGGSTSVNGATYWCCQKGEKNVAWVRADNWETTTIDEENSLKITTNACGQEVSRVVWCDTSRKIYRQNQCVDDCPDNQAFESKNSATCVECPQSIAQGVAINPDDGTRYCLKCNTDKEFFKDGKCVSISSFTKLSYTNQSDCFMCDNPSDLKKCLQKKARGDNSGVVMDCASYVSGFKVNPITLGKAFNIDLLKLKPTDVQTTSKIKLAPKL